jgi:hypothetical protein
MINGLMPEHPTEKMHNILELFIRYQYRANAAITLGQIHQLDYKTYKLHPDILTFLTQERESILEVLQVELENNHPSERQSLISLFVTTTQEFIYQQNQFITLSPNDKVELIQLYRQFLVDTANILAQEQDYHKFEQLYQTVLEDHFFYLKSFITKLGETQGKSLIFQQVVCEEYPAPLQLEVLGIDRETLKEPILDIGCGKHGTLVAHLRQYGLDAFGIDRLVMPSDYLIETDWLEFQFVPSSWGTVISHMAFSNHFIFHHLYRNGTPEIYATKYMEILASLKRGGEMFYAPGLSFMEQLLPATDFAITPKNVDVPGQDKLGPNSVYATIIRRLAT